MTGVWGVTAGDTGWWAAQVLTDEDDTNNDQLTALYSDKYEEFTIPLYEEFTTPLVRNTKYFEFLLA